MLLYYICPAIYKNNPVAKAIRMVKVAPLVLSYQTYNPGYNFYLDGSVQKYDSVDSLIARLLQNLNALVITRKQGVGLLKSSGLHIVAEHRDLFKLPVTVILKKDE